MARQLEIFQIFLSLRREQMAQQQGETSPGGIASYRLDDQASSWLTSALLERAGWSDYVFAFHDREEIGPKMLAKIAKKTGLRPEDL